MYRFVYDYGLWWLKAFVCSHCCCRFQLILVHFIIHIKIAKCRHRPKPNDKNNNQVNKFNGHKKEIAVKWFWLMLGARGRACVTYFHIVCWSFDCAVFVYEFCGHIIDGK